MTKHPDSAGLREIDLTAITADAERAVDLADVNGATNTVNAETDISRETQPHAMPDLDDYILATHFALYEQSTKYLPHNDVVAIQLGAAARRSLDLDDCRIAIHSRDVNAAVDRRHFNVRSSGERKASIDFIAVLFSRLNRADEADEDNC